MLFCSSAQSMIEGYDCLNCIISVGRFSKFSFKQSLLGSKNFKIVCVCIPHKQAGVMHRSFKRDYLFLSSANLSRAVCQEASASLASMPASSSFCWKLRDAISYSALAIFKSASFVPLLNIGAAIEPSRFAIHAEGFPTPPPDNVAHPAIPVSEQFFPRHFRDMRCDCIHYADFFTRHILYWHSPICCIIRIHS